MINWTCPGCPCPRLPLLSIIDTSPKRQRVNAVPKARVPTCLKIATRGFTCLRCGLVLAEEKADTQQLTTGIVEGNC